MQATAASTAVTPKQLAEELMALWHDLMRGGASSVYELVAKLDLSLTQMKTLHALADSAAEVSVKDLADRLGLSLPATSRTVDALLRRGWLERREDEYDRRIKRVGITPEGRDVIERIDAARLVGIEKYTASLTPEQRSVLSSALSKLPHHQ